MASLNAAWQAASEEMYKATQGAGANPQANADANAGTDAKNSDVTDVEFEEVKEEKK